MPNHPPLSRREWLKLSAAGVGAISASGWLGSMAAAAAKTGKTPKSCILLWMDGGPSQHDTFDMKPDAPAEVRGDFKPIQTTVPGIQITEMFPNLAKHMQHATILRGMSTGESEHGRARIYLHTGYKQGTAGLNYPTMGSLLTATKQGDGELPNFVVTGKHLNPANWSYVSSPGYLGPRHAPMIVPDASAGVANLKPSAEASDYADRLSVLEEMTRGFLRESPSSAATAQQAVYQRTVKLIRSPKGKAFDLSQEPAKVHDAYGKHAFGQGCLLARRLVEVGVPFIEVYHAPTPGGWDNHSPDRVKEVKTLAMPQLDQGMPALIADLKDRGLLDSTLIVWMGEFGRTPKVNAKGGRDHYGRAWTSMLVGGGLKGGRIIGATDAQGATVKEKPISAADFMATMGRIFGLDEHQSFQVGPRPVRAVSKGAVVIEEILS